MHTTSSSRCEGFRAARARPTKPWQQCLLRYFPGLARYAGGNLILADSSYEILTLLRSHRDDDKGLVIMPKVPYPIAACRLWAPFTEPELAAAVAAAKAGELKSVLANAVPWCADGNLGAQPLAPGSTRNRPAHRYSPAVAEHALLLAGIDPARKLQPGEMLSPLDSTKIMGAVQVRPSVRPATAVGAEVPMPPPLPWTL